MRATTQLRQLLAEPGMSVAPGCYDCLGARLIESAGFALAYVSGGSMAMALGFPDYGLTTMTEVVEAAGRIADSIKIPVISDADTGFGNELHVTRTVRAFEARGIAGIHIEDQEFPKRCGHLAGKAVISVDDYARKISAAVEARRDPDFVIIARIDSRAVYGFEDAVERCNAAIAAGADVIFMEAPESEAEMAEIPQRIEAPCLLNGAFTGVTPNLTSSEVEAMGFKVMIVPGAQVVTTTIAVAEVLNYIMKTGQHPPHQFDSGVNIEALMRASGCDEWDQIRSKYVADATGSGPWDR